MDELYQAIEEKIKSSGYPREISGEAVYEDICDQIDGKENGTYVLLSKFEDIRERFPARLFMKISVIRSREKKTAVMCYCPNLMTM